MQATAERTPFGRASLDRLLELAAGGIEEIAGLQARVIAEPMRGSFSRRVTRTRPSS